LPTPPGNRQTTMTWPAFRYNQTDIVALSATPPFVAREYHVQNELYGYHSLIKQYAGLPGDKALPFAMEHAITFEDPAGYPPDINSRLPIILAVSEGQASLLRTRTHARVEPIGSSFFYMQRMAGELFAQTPPERRGTLVFPDKSTVEKDTDFDRDAYARRLADLPAEFQPVAVSMPWRDVQRGAFAAFERAGLMVVTSGHPHDPLFLFRQYDLCRHFKYAAANDISTSFCMSVLSGCRFFYLPGGPLTVTEHGVTTVYDDEPTLHLPAKQACLEASPFPPSGAGSAQLQLAEHYAGKAFVRPPEFFRAAAGEGYAMLQATQPASVSMLPGGPLDKLAPWLTNGIDADGWVFKTASFRLPARTGHWGVRLRFAVPRPKGWRSKLRVVFGRDCRDLSIRRGSWILEVACGPSGQNLDVEIHLNDDIQLAGDRRRRTYRIETIEWLDRPKRMWFGRVRLWRDRNTRWSRFLTARKPPVR
jgi:hypothetical protein